MVIFCLNYLEMIFTQKHTNHDNQIIVTVLINIFKNKKKTYKTNTKTILHLEVDESDIIYFNLLNKKKIKNYCFIYYYVGVLNSNL